MKKIQYGLTAVAFVCILASSVRGAVSYFSTYAEARGGVELGLVEDTRITEEWDGKKILTVHNDDTNVEVYIRARAFVGSEYTLTCEGEDWVDGGDGYWYYRGSDGKGIILAPGADTTPLKVGFTTPAEPGEGDEFNVVVIYESVPVLYDESGNAVEDWTQKLTVKTEGGN